MLTKTLKVCDLPAGKKYAPGLNLKGDYLRAFGFEVGDIVSVELTAGKIVISKEKTI